ncbi:MAG: type VI secretion system contractile sheath large subunit [Deltaproteobacteria bacterium]|nr:type VI secretion system contractile sheath large subunit [Deltaproteobacteria bacterium]MBW1928448.1 type VI secretion system contractile sheath large subunit [Deltaproteobacteria bacterium]MBW2024217.1 type VI secretion system contractile sheath large subunit [Deltaproteobacteria bacterium]MBW2125729.1 type VI secretion system contractile sheath large subunit [Deltaproteobacteria bacterium]RLB23824.1 MAG: type VI secretion system contractile sheath large subunit [Deltaproteobacteria bacter
MAEEQERSVATEEKTLEEGSLLEEIVQATKLKPSDEAYSLAKRGVEALIAQLLEPGREVPKVSKAVVDEMIAEIDKKMSLQLDAILHHPEFQKLESAWRSLKFLVDRTDFRENIRIEVINVSKEDLLEDFEDSPEVVKSGLYKTVYTAEYGQFGGQPYAAMIGNYEFGPGPQDIKLLQYVASVAAMAHAPFIAAAGPQFFGLENFNGLPNLKDLKSIFESPQYAKWQSFRESEDARYVGLTLPRFLLRLPYGPDTQPVKAFNYQEDVSSNHEHYLWGNTAFAFASRLTDSFAKYRWCANIIGPMGGGAVEDLPLHQYEAMGAIQTKIPTEVLISERREFELAEEGFIALTMRKGSDNAAFFSANSCQKPKFFGISKEGKEAELNYKLGLQLPYMFIINRLAHYLKVIQRENIGTWKERVDLERELNNWIRQYVADMDNPQPGVRSRRPLRQAQVTVEDVEGEPGWYRVGLKVRPHFKYMGAFFTLSLVGKLDKE